MKQYNLAQQYPVIYFLILLSNFFIFIINFFHIYYQNQADKSKCEKSPTYIDQNFKQRFISRKFFTLITGF